MDNDDKQLLEELRQEWTSSPFVMLGLSHHPALSEPMTVKFDEHSYPESLYFFTYTDNRLMRALGKAGPDAVLTYMSKDHELFATLSGRLIPSNDKALIDRFWSNGVAAWFEGGKSDPTLQLLQFDVAHMEVWKADVSVAGKLKLMFGGEVKREDFQGEHTNAVL